MSKGLKIIDQVGGETRAVAGHGGYLYVGMGYRVLVLDAADPRHPRLVGRSEPLSLVHTVTADGGLALVKVVREMIVLDVSDPTQPRRVGRFSEGHWIPGCALKGRYAYAVGGVGTPSLRIFDLAQPARPKLIGAVVPSATVAGRKSSNPQEAEGLQMDAVFISGGRAFVSTSEGLAIFDVTRPTRPAHVRSLDIGTPCHSVWVDGTQVYLGANDGLVSVDATDPTWPRLMGRFGTNAEIGSPLVDDGYLYATDNGGLWVFDVTHPATPVAKSYLRLAAPSHVAKLGPCVYVADERMGLRIFDVSDPTRPVELPVDLGFLDASSVALTDRYLYVVDGRPWPHGTPLPCSPPLKVGERPGGVRVLPRRPSGLETGPNWPIHRGDARELTIAGKRGYLRTTEEVTLVDLSDPERPKAVGGLQLWGTPCRFVLGGRYAYVATSNGFGILDISRPTSVKDVWFAAMHGGALDLVVQAPRVFAVGENGLVIFDVPRPRWMRRVGELTLPDSVRCAAVVGNHAYVGGIWGQLFIVDVSDLTHPKLVSGTSESEYGWYNRLKVAGNRLYALNSYTITVLDVSDPLRPTILAREDLSDEGGVLPVDTDLAIADGLIYLASGNCGLLILEDPGAQQRTPDKLSEHSRRRRRPLRPLLDPVPGAPGA